MIVHGSLYSLMTLMLFVSVSCSSKAQDQEVNKQSTFTHPPARPTVAVPTVEISTPKSLIDSSNVLILFRGDSLEFTINEEKQLVGEDELELFVQKYSAVIKDKKVYMLIRKEEHLDLGGKVIDVLRKNGVKMIFT